jgi:hypothetical protein
VRCAARAELERLLDEAPDEGQRAELHYLLWRTAPESPLESNEAIDHRDEALRIYRAFVDESPTHAYLKRIAELSIGVATRADDAIDAGAENEPPRIMPTAHRDTRD